MQVALHRTYHDIVISTASSSFNLHVHKCHSNSGKRRKDDPPEAICVSRVSTWIILGSDHTRRSTEYTPTTCKIQALHWKCGQPSLVLKVKSTRASKAKLQKKVLLDCVEAYRLELPYRMPWTPYDQLQRSWIERQCNCQMKWWRVQWKNFCTNGAN